MNISALYCFNEYIYIYIYIYIYMHRGSFFSLNMFDWIRQILCFSLFYCWSLLQVFIRIIWLLDGINSRKSHIFPNFFLYKCIWLVTVFVILLLDPLKMTLAGVKSTLGKYGWIHFIPSQMTCTKTWTNQWKNRQKLKVCSIKSNI